MSKRSESRVVGDNIEKKCTACNEFKALHEFHQAATSSYGVQNKCKECYKKVYQENREEMLAKQREYQQNNKEKISAYNFKRHIRDRYGLSEEEYDALSVNGCSICGTHDDLAVDHDHTTTKVRGILCRNCNRGLGIFKDNIYFLLRAAAYLEEKQGCAIPGIGPV